MINLSTQYMGFNLKNPIIIGSSGLTKSVEKIKEFENKGAGAVVLKSLFEEQIMHTADKFLSYPDSYNNFPEATDYINNYTNEFSVESYMNLIRNVKKEVKIPIIGSINCVSTNEWIHAAKDIERAGADAIELNIFILPYHIDMNGEEYEKMYFDLIEKIKSHISIPISIKIGYYFSGLVSMIQKLSWTGIKAIVMFNRFFTPDIDLQTMKLKVTNVFSSPKELPVSLRWIALVANKVKCDISASTGIHDADAVIKELLVGATTTQICSTIYKNGSDVIPEIIDGISSWMSMKMYSSINEFRGKFSVNKIDNPILYHRVQYMKHLSGKE